MPSVMPQHGTETAQHDTSTWLTMALGQLNKTETTQHEVSTLLNMALGQLDNIPQHGTETASSTLVEPAATVRSGNDVKTESGTTSQVEPPTSATSEPLTSKTIATKAWDTASTTNMPPSPPSITLNATTAGNLPKLVSSPNDEWCSCVHGECNEGHCR